MEAPGLSQVQQAWCLSCKCYWDLVVTILALLSFCDISGNGKDIGMFAYLFV
jgi:hypothetical protein